MLSLILPPSPFLLKLAAPLIALWHTQAVDKQLSQWLPDDLKKKIILLGVSSSTTQMSYLPYQIAYCLNMRTINKEFCNALDMESILDFCSPIDYEKINRFFVRTIERCPVEIAKLLIQHGADIYRPYDKWIDIDPDDYATPYDRIVIRVTLLPDAIKENKPELAKKLQELGAELKA